MKQTKDDEEGTINKALRREVLAYTTDGIAQSLDRAQEIATQTHADNNSLPRAADYPTGLGGINGNSIQAFTMHIIYNEELLYGRKGANTLSSDEAGNVSDKPGGRQHLLAQSRTQQSAIGVLPEKANEPPRKQRSGSRRLKTSRQVKREREFVDYAPLVEYDTNITLCLKLLRVVAFPVVCAWVDCVCVRFLCFLFCFVFGVLLLYCFACGKCLPVILG